MVETTSQEQPLGADAPLLVSIRGTARTEIRRDRRLSREVIAATARAHALGKRRQRDLRRAVLPTGS